MESFWVPCMSMQVAVTAGPGQAPRVFSFGWGADERPPLACFGHVDGCKVCESLFQHFLLPNGKQAHFYHDQAGSLQAFLVPHEAPPGPPTTIAGCYQVCGCNGFPTIINQF